MGFGREKQLRVKGKRERELAVQLQFGLTWEDRVIPILRVGLHLAVSSFALSIHL